MQTSVPNASDHMAVAESLRLRCQQSQILVGNTRLAISVLHTQIASSRQRLAESRRLLARRGGDTGTEPGGAEPVAAPSPTPTNVGTVRRAGRPRTFAAVAELIARVERVSRHETNHMDHLVALIKDAIGDSSEPYVLMGVLAEGIVQTLIRRLPASERDQGLPAVLRLLRDRCGLHDDFALPND